MHTLVRKTLEVYLREKRVITPSDFPTEVSQYTSIKDAIFITLYLEWRVIASSGRIACKKENSLFECIDNTLLCLKDPRFSQEIQDIAKLSDIHIRTDQFRPENRRVLRTISELDTTKEGLILLSQSLGVLSMVLPHMVNLDSSPEKYFSLACKKWGIDPINLNPADYVIYGLTTVSESDFGNDTI